MHILLLLGRIDVHHGGQCNLLTWRSWAITNSMCQCLFQMGSTGHCFWWIPLSNATLCHCGWSAVFSDLFVRLQ